MVTVDGWYAEGVRSLREEYLINNGIIRGDIIQHCLDIRSHNYGSREIIPLFYNPYRKGRPSPPVVALTLMPFKAM